MPSFIAEFRKTGQAFVNGELAGNNAEYTRIPIEADNKTAAEKSANALLKLLPEMHPGWVNRGHEPKFWGLPESYALVGVTNA